ncbi:hypothetical protein K8T06_12140, partial [bacterium]|nr:hypothetical protein [bacterium]
MRVLHLPHNIASQISVTVRALRELGLEARGVVVDNSKIQDPTGVELLPLIPSRKRHPIKGTLQMWANRKAILEAINWADVVHWHYSWALKNAYDVSFAAESGKAGIVEFWGSDIRIPRIAVQNNPYRIKFYQSYPELSKSAEKRSLNKQMIFSKHDIACLLPGPGVRLHIDKQFFPKPYVTRQRIHLEHYEPNYPNPGQSKPVIVHMPSHKARKGTDA